MTSKVESACKTFAKTLANYDGHFMEGIYLTVLGDPDLLQIRLQGEPGRPDLEIPLEMFVFSL